jgi:thiol-disulfide isomerase/thioredoxin
MSLLTLLVAATSMLGAQAPAPAADLMAKAQSNAAKRGTNVMVIFHASWCGWCKRLDAFMARPAYKKLFADNYEIVHLDVLENGDKKSLENPGGFEVMKKYGGEGAGLPWIFIADKNGKKLIDSFRDGNPKQNIGCPWEPDEVKWFLTMFDKTRKQITPEQRRALESDLLKQKTEKPGGGS